MSEVKGIEIEIGGKRIGELPTLWYRDQKTGERDFGPFGCVVQATRYINFLYDEDGNLYRYEVWGPVDKNEEEHKLSVTIPVTREEAEAEVAAIRAANAKVAA